MERFPSLIISQDDFHKISAVLSLARGEIAELLEEELARAKLVPSEDLPSDAVAMSSQVTFLDLKTDKEQTVVLAFPHEADIERQRISILAPIGVALIGMRVGQVIDCPMPDDNVRRLKVLSVEQQRKSA